MRLDNLITVVKPMLLTKSIKDYLAVFEVIKKNTKELSGEPVVFTLSDYNYTKKSWQLIPYKSETGVRNVLFHYCLSTGFVSRVELIDFFKECMTIAGYNSADSIKWLKGKFASLYDYTVKEKDSLKLSKPVDYKTCLRWATI
ncbi:MAG TPA: hypothetical protein VI790_00180 [Candidatus Nanoarchaeia archaeon]|nr:hypothetical protein [Candidatus Nanoarchaeia archaeon]